MTTCIRSLTAFLFSVLCLQAMAPTVHAQLGNTPWPMFQHDARHTGRSAFSGPASPQPKWATPYKGVNWIKSQTTLGPGGTTAYVGVGFNPLCSVNTANGQEIACLGIGGDACSSSPAVGADGTVYIGGRDNKLWAVKPDGSGLFTNVKEFKINFDGDNLSSPVIAPDGTIYTACNCIGAGRVYALNPLTLTPKPGWPFAAGTGIRNSSPALAANGTVYIGLVNGNLLALNPDGSLQRRVKVGTKILNSSPSIAADGTIYIGSTAGLSAVNPVTGTIMWTFQTAGEVDTTAAIAADGALYVSSYKTGNRTFYKLSAAGAEIWRVTAKGGKPTQYSQSPSAVIGANGTIYTAIGKTVYAFAPASNVPLWTTQLGADAIALSLGNGVLYVSAKNTLLYAFGS